MLEELFGKLGLTEDSRLLDVGCGAGRALAYFAAENLPGTATGVELDPKLAARALFWAKDHPDITIKSGSVLDLDLHSFTHFYLFNPFDTPVLMRFLEKLERDKTARTQEDGPENPEPVVLCHMSDNGENYWYMGRPGWTLREEGAFQMTQGLRAYDHPQHWSIWEFDPQALR